MAEQAAGHARPAIGFKEFVGLMAALMAIQAIPIDAMLPALPAIVRVPSKEYHHIARACDY